MTTTTLLLYLIGDRDAILHIASDRWSLAIGFLFVLSAGFARNYARKDLRREPWHLLMPFAASVVSSFWLFAFIYFLAFQDIFSTQGKIERVIPNAPLLPLPAIKSFVSRYLSFLGLYWMTAPLALIYAIPVEKWCSRIGAVKARLCMLSLVATWRVVLMIAVLYAVLEADNLALGSGVLCYVSALALLLILLTWKREWLVKHTHSRPAAPPVEVAFETEDESPSIESVPEIVEAMSAIASPSAPSESSVESLGKTESVESAPQVFAAMSGIPEPPIAVPSMPTVTNPEQRLLRRVGTAVAVGALALTVYGALGLIASPDPAERWRFTNLSPAATAVPRFDLWLAAIASLALWVFILPATQRRARLARRVIELINAGCHVEAFEVITRQDINAFPVHWEPPAASFVRHAEGLWLLDAIERTLDDKKLSWLQAGYRDRLEIFVSDARWFWNTPDLAQLVRVLQKLPSSNELAKIANVSMQKLVEENKVIVEYNNELREAYKDDEQSSIELEKFLDELTPEESIDPAPPKTAERVKALEVLRALGNSATN